MVYRCFTNVACYGFLHNPAQPTTSQGFIEHPTVFYTSDSIVVTWWFRCDAVSKHPKAAMLQMFKKKLNTMIKAVTVR